jgi:hypothetical protein
VVGSEERHCRCREVLNIVGRVEFGRRLLMERTKKVEVVNRDGNSNNKLQVTYRGF